jgi:hypothetical protein
VILDVLSAVTRNTSVFMFVTIVLWWMFTDVSDELIASFFWVVYSRKP